MSDLVQLILRSADENGGNVKLLEDYNFDDAAGKETVTVPEWCMAAGAHFKKKHGATLGSVIHMKAIAVFWSHALPDAPTDSHNVEIARIIGREH